MVQIRLEDRCYPVSKRKLIEQSDYFRALYRSGMREALSQEAGGPEVQQLRGLSAPGLRLVLDFINTGGAREGWLLGPRGEKGGGAAEDEEMDEVERCHLSFHSAPLPSLPPPPPLTGTLTNSFFTGLPTFPQTSLS